ncbi:WD40 repeat protein [Ceraceosorus bombacis]|uniref:WD repeat-containing protein JIP5 n=1 Tax=Ceraceosorus bombacis TaxID=401625 RepID=A0A0P1BFH1_9BASI|nr:WD40 repeat protein [Ceraceosorus bombacis]
MDIPLSSDCLDVSFHPKADTSLIAASLVSGKVQLLDYSPSQRTSAQKGKAAAGQDAKLDEADDSDEDEEASSPASGSSSPWPRGNKGHTKLWATRPTNKSCRGAAFDEQGDSVWVISKDGSLSRLGTETGSVVQQWKGAHSAAPSRILPVSCSLLATGDDDGVVALWDPRRPPKNALSGSSSSVKPSKSTSEAAQSCLSAGAVRSYSHHFDWITCMIHVADLTPPKELRKRPDEIRKAQKREAKKAKRRQMRGLGAMEDESADKLGRERLVVTSGDGTLSVIDPRVGPSAVEVSEDQEDELLGVAAIKRGNKLVVGTQLGMLSVWAPSRGLLDHVDRIPGHPQSVDALCMLDQDTVLTGSSDGLIRVVQVLPNKLLGVVADHNGLPVERIARKEGWVASVGHGPEIKLTDKHTDAPSHVGSDSESDTDDDEEEEEAGDPDAKDASEDEAAVERPSKRSKTQSASGKAAQSRQAADDDFFAGF